MAEARGAKVRTAPVKVPVNVVPTLREERRLLRAGHRLVAAVDEVGRGALAGPVTVGIVIVDESTRSAPAGVRDSKLLTPAARMALAPRLRRWAPAYAVGHAEPHEIDQVGIIAALRMAAWRALAQIDVKPDCVLLDGSHDWLTTPPALFGPDLCIPDLAVEPPVVPSTVVTRVKADMRCAAVAAASVLAKVERDAIMVTRSQQYPEYCWEDNKGYSAPEHVAALRRFGATAQHRRSWSLPGLSADVIALLDGRSPSASSDGAAESPAEAGGAQTHHEAENDVDERRPHSAVLDEAASLMPEGAVRGSADRGREAGRGPATAGQGGGGACSGATGDDDNAAGRDAGARSAPRSPLPVEPLSGQRPAEAGTH